MNYFIDEILYRKDIKFTLERNLEGYVCTNCDFNPGHRFPCGDKMEKYFVECNDANYSYDTHIKYLW